MTRTFLFAAMFACLAPLAAQAHEVWIAPEDWTPEPGEKIAAALRNGHEFSGFGLVWNADATQRAELWTRDGMTPIEGRLGDRPALATRAPEAGLATLLYQSTYRRLVYDSYETFAGFVTEKGHDPVLEAHDARGLSRAAIAEAYMRFAKALVGVGDGGGRDAARGMELELLALDNPYAAGVERMRTRLIYRSEPHADTQVAVFSRDAEGHVTRRVMRTDARGEVAFAVAPGETYLVDAVIIREPSRALVAASRGAVWESLWASLTFQVPETPAVAQ